MVKGWVSGRAVQTTTNLKNGWWCWWLDWLQACCQLSQSPMTVAVMSQPFASIPYKTTRRLCAHSPSHSFYGLSFADSLWATLPSMLLATSTKLAYAKAVTGNWATEQLYFSVASLIVCQFQLQLVLQVGCLCTSIGLL